MPKGAQSSFFPLLLQVVQCKERSERLMGLLEARRAERSQLQGQLQEAEANWSNTVADHVQLQAEVHSMRHLLEVCLQLHAFHIMQTLSGACCRLCCGALRGLSAIVPSFCLICGHCVKRACAEMHAARTCPSR